MGRYLDTTLIDRLSEATHLGLTFFRPDDPQRPIETHDLHTPGTIP